MAIYVTFTEEEYRVAIKCDTEEEAMDVATDVCSLAGVKNVRIRRSGKPRATHFYDYQDYYTYKTWDC